MRTVVAPSQSFQSFSVVFYLPAIASGIFGVYPLYAIMGDIFFKMFVVVGRTYSGQLQNRIGIKKTVQICYVLCIVALVTIGLTMNTLDKYVVCLLTGMFMRGHTLGPGIDGMAFLPTEIRGIGCGWAQTMVCATYVIQSIFLYLACMPLAAVLILCALNWEPIGKDIESETFEQIH